MMVQILSGGSTIILIVAKTMPTKPRKEKQMPAKKVPTDDDKKTKIRQEGRRGYLIVSHEFTDTHGEQKQRELFKHIGFQVFARMKGAASDQFYGYCPLFASLTVEEKSLYYKMRVDLSEPDPIVEMFIVPKEEKK
jgi:hypothetical protein